MKKILICFCVAFTTIVLLTSFTSTKLGRIDAGISWPDLQAHEIMDNSGSKYIVVSNEHGVAICPKVKQ